MTFVSDFSQVYGYGMDHIKRIEDVRKAEEARKTEEVNKKTTKTGKRVGRIAQIDREEMHDQSSEEKKREDGSEAESGEKSEKIDKEGSESDNEKEDEEEGRETGEDEEEEEKERINHETKEEDDIYDRVRRVVDPVTPWKSLSPGEVANLATVKIVDEVFQYLVMTTSGGPSGTTSSAASQPQTEGAVRQVVDVVMSWKALSLKVGNRESALKMVDEVLLLLTMGGPTAPSRTNASAGNDSQTLNKSAKGASSSKCMSMATTTLTKPSLRSKRTAMATRPPRRSKRKK
ncbi:hypothetical protein Sjap_021828 [Stephania japonica]|uniref:Uncharacterized protein n=1 Tax=Stephania japonica TaxID=461633 RepID=A0AAP0HTU9_9MAGN